MSVPKGVLFGMGNPLLDISAHVPQSVLDRYELKAGNACLAEPKHLPLYEELIRDYTVEYIAGGATQNSIRAAQYMLQSPGATTYIGCIGNDSYGQALTKAATADGVDVHYAVDYETQTGTCAVCVVASERSLCANLGAANKYKLEHLLQPEQQKLIEQAKFFYIAGFFLTVCPEAALHVAKHATDNKKTFALNIAAPFIAEYFGQHIDALMPHVDYLFGNEHEFAAIGKVKGWGEELEEVAKQLAALPKEGSNPRVVICTQGSKAVILVTNGVVYHYAVPKMAKEDIVDTNGAGDSFVGGFLAYLIKGSPVADCVAAGNYCAQEVLKRSGAQYPSQPPTFKPATSESS